MFRKALAYSAVPTLAMCALLFLTAIVGSNGTNDTVDGSGLRWIGVATGSLATCDSTKKGLINFDTTTNTIKICSGSTAAWHSVISNLVSYDAALYLPGTTGTGVAGAQIVPGNNLPSTGGFTYTVAIGSLSTLVAGTGAGNYTLSLVEAGGAGTLVTTGNIACASAVGNVSGATTSASSALSSTNNRAVSIQFASDGCTTRPTVSASVRVDITP